MHTMPRTGPILNFVVDDDLIRRLDDFRYTRRFPSRAAAVKALLRWALDQQPDPAAANVPPKATPRRTPPRLVRHPPAGYVAERKESQHDR